MEDNIITQDIRYIFDLALNFDHHGDIDQYLRNIDVLKDKATGFYKNLFSTDTGKSDIGINNNPEDKIEKQDSPVDAKDVFKNARSVLERDPYLTDIEKAALHGLMVGELGKKLGNLTISDLNKLGILASPESNTKPLRLNKNMTLSEIEKYSAIANENPSTHICTPFGDKNEFCDLQKECEDIRLPVRTEHHPSTIQSFINGKRAMDILAVAESRADKIVEAIKAKEEKKPKAAPAPSKKKKAPSKKKKK